MTQAYSNPDRENDENALPDIEVFYVSSEDGAGMEWGNPDGIGRYESGWYWWSCFPGCMPDSDPTGPYETEAEALAAAQQY